MFSEVVEELIELCSTKSRTYDSKTINRDLGIGTKELYRINDLRVEKYARWLYSKAEVSSDEIGRWLDLTDYKWPGELLLKITKGIEKDSELYELARRDPDLPRPKLWTDEVLGRHAEIEAAIEWADDRQHFPIAVLYGFGGTGKTTLQLKLGREFVIGSTRTLRWPFEGAVWMSANENRNLSLPGIWRKILKVFDSSRSAASNPEFVERAVRNLLEEKRILVLIDGFEAVSSLEEQENILKFFNNLEGYSKALLSSRYNLSDLLTRHELLSETRYIKVEGLSPEHTTELISEYITRTGIPPELYPSSELLRLARITGRNPQVIITVLGIIATRWISLADQLDSIESGKPDKIFDELIGHRWERSFTSEVKSVLMAKAFFSRPASPDALAQVAELDKLEFEAACDVLESISFFEKEGSSHWRISAHPLAQAYAVRMIQDDPNSLEQMEHRWWSAYGPGVLREASKVSYEAVETELEDSVYDVLAHIEKHIADAKSHHRMKAVNLLLSGVESPARDDDLTSHGIGHILRHWGKWDDLIRIAELSLDHIKNDPRLIRECVLRLLTRAHYERREVADAWKYIALAEAENVKLKNRRLEAAILYSRAEVLRQQGEFSLAKDSLQRALIIFGEAGGNHICDIAPTYMVLGGCTTELAVQNLIDGVVDRDHFAAEGLLEAEAYLAESERLFNSQPIDYPEKNFDIASIRAYRAVIARLRGQFDVARELFETCERQFPSIASVARLHRERALVEHLDGNREKAHSFEEKGLALMEQVGLRAAQLPKYNCYRVIEGMKARGTW